jgi:hypothetical protein
LKLPQELPGDIARDGGAETAKKRGNKTDCVFIIVKPAFHEWPVIWRAKIKLQPETPETFPAQRFTDESEATSEERCFKELCIVGSARDFVREGATAYGRLGR